MVNPIMFVWLLNSCSRSRNDLVNCYKYISRGLGVVTHCVPGRDTFHEGHRSVRVLEINTVSSDPNRLIRACLKLNVISVLQSSENRKQADAPSLSVQGGVEDCMYGPCAVL